MTLSIDEGLPVELFIALSLNLHLLAGHHHRRRTGIADIGYVQHRDVDAPL